MTSPKDIAVFLEEYWHAYTGLVAAEIFSMAGAFFLLNSLQPTIWWWVGIFIFTPASIYIIWRITTGPPVVPKNKIGFLVSISCSDESERKTIREDFVAPLRQLVKSGKAGSSFQFIELPEYYAEKVVDTDTANEMRVRCNAHFMIYGRVRNRVINKVETHVIELEGAVAHRPIPEIIQQSLANEFAELLPRNVHVQKENDLFSFKFTSEWADAVARYVIGIAAAYSGDIEYAEELYKDVLVILQNKEQTFPVFRKLKERVPLRLAELYEAKASNCFEQWVENHDISELNEVENWLGKIVEHHQNRVLVITLRAILAFLKDRSVDNAIGKFKKIKNDRSRIWQCNMAFLYAYKGNLQKAARHYRQASQCDLDLEKLYQIEEFISWVLDQEPKMYQLLYAQGLINMYIKEDKTLAKEYFNKFIAICPVDMYLQERTLIQSWMDGE